MRFLEPKSSNRARKGLLADEASRCTKLQLRAPMAIASKKPMLVESPETPGFTDCDQLPKDGKYGQKQKIWPKAKSS